MTKKLLIVGDCHCSSSTLPDVRYAFRQITKVLRQEKIDVLCFAGDIFDLHSSIKSEPYNFFINSISKWLDKFINLEIILIVGNHDFINNAVYCTDEHFLNAFKKWERVVVIDFPQEYTIEKHKIALFPYVPEGRYFEAHQEFLKGSFDFSLFISHQTFRGGRMDNGIPSETSDVWAPNYPLQISGHLHTPHTVAENLEYIGSLIHCKHSEEGLKRLMLVELVDKEYEIMDLELKPLNLYETIIFNIKTDDITTIKVGKNIRYTLTGGTTGELLIFSKQYKNIFNDKVKYKAIDAPGKLNLTIDGPNPLTELKTLIDPELIDLLDIPDESQGRYTLETPGDNLILEVTNFIQVKKKKFKLTTGLTALRGDNGAGKTTTLNAILWLLYGGNSPDGKKTVVSLCDGDKWEIKRITSPKGLTLTIGDEVYKDDSAQNIINNTFGIKSVWVAVNYLEQKKNCNFFGYTGNEKKTFLSNIFQHSGVIRRVCELLGDEEKEAKKSFDDLERTYKELVDLIGEEPEESPILNLIGLDDIPEEELIELEKPELPLIPDPPLPYFDDLQEPEKPDLSHLEELKRPDEPPKPEIPPLYLEDLQEPARPDVSHLAPLPEPEEPPKPILRPLYLDDLQEPEKPRYVAPKGLPQPDLSIWEEIEVPRYSIEKAKNKLDKLEETLNIVQENARKEARRKELKGKQMKKEDFNAAERMLRLQEELEELKEIKAASFTKEEIKKLRLQIENTELKHKYRQLYQREPTLKRIEELDLAFKYNDALEAECPQCNTELLALITRNKTIDLVISEGQKSTEKPDDKERKLLLQIDFKLPDPIMTVEEANLKQKKYDLLKNYIPANYATIVEEQRVIQTELKLLKPVEVENITNTEIEAAKQKLERCYEYKQIEKDNMRKQIERKRILQQWENENNQVKAIHEAEYKEVLKRWEEACFNIAKARKQRESHWLAEKELLYQTWNDEKEVLITKWKKENKIRQQEKENILKSWYDGCEKIKELRKERSERWKEEGKKLFTIWERKRDLIITEWQNENNRRLVESERLLTHWKNALKKITEEKGIRMKRWQDEKDQLHQKWGNDCNKLMQLWKIENQKRAKLRTENKQRQEERERRTLEHEKQLKEVKRRNSKRVKLQRRREAGSIHYAKMRDTLKICKEFETKYFEQQLEVFNIAFEKAISSLLVGGTGRISSVKENANKTTKDAITLEIWLDGIKRVDAKNLSAGERDLISIAFQVALISITPSAFKLILLDEPFSQLNKERIPVVVSFLEEYLSNYHCLIVIHDEGFLNESEIYLSRS